MKKIIGSERIPIKMWLDDAEESALEQTKNVANLPFAFKHIAIMADNHFGVGVGIGTVLATKGVVIPNAVGVDISCGIVSVKTDLRAENLDQEIIKKIMGGARMRIPFGLGNVHSTIKYENWMPKVEINKKDYPIISQEHDSAMYALGSNGSGNHYWEVQKDQDGFIWFMIHSGSRNLGLKVANYHNNVAVELNEKYFSQVPESYKLAFLPFDSDEGRIYWNEMNYCMEFAKQSRALMAHITKECFLEHIPNINFTWEHDINHNYAAMENHFGVNVVVHRKGATRARKGEIGMIPGSMGSSSYIVRGLGNPESFMSCSHGAGRKMSRTKAKQTLNLVEEIKKLNDQGIIHGIRNLNDLDEATGSYKDIEVVIANQSDLVEIVTTLTPLAVIKG